MDVNGVSSSSSTYSTSSSKTGAKANDTNQTANAAGTSNVKNDAAVYDKKSSAKTQYKPDTQTLEKIKKDVLAQTENLRNLVTKLIAKQGDKWNSASDFLVDIDEETRLEAQKLVAEDGYYGVQQTTDRIIGFAKAISGGDPSKIDLLRNAVEKGFKNAADIWGGELPEISQKTYDSVMAEFDKWKNEGTGQTEEVQ